MPQDLTPTAASQAESSSAAPGADGAAPPPGAHGTTGQPWVFIPVLYFLEGVPYVIVATVSVLMFNKLGVPNDQVGLWTSLITLPWTVKMLWGPLVDLTLTKRRWVLATQALILCGLAAGAVTVSLPQFLAPTLAVFALVAVLSATHDIAADGFYLLSLEEKAQAFFVGVRSTFYRLATIFGTGFLVWLAGRVLLAQGEAPGDWLTPFFRGLDGAAAALVHGPVHRAWALALGIGAAVYGLAYLANHLVLPRPPTDVPRTRAERDGAAPWLEVLVTFFRQRRILWILAFILFYRLGESMIGKMSGPFLQDPAGKGGLGIPTDQIGIISGVVGVLALTFGGILGGVVIAKFGIKRCIWPMVLCLNVPNLFYVWAAFARPGPEAVAALIAVDQFGYGFGFSAYMVYLMFVSQGTRYETSHYAVATGLMALGALGAGILSGYLQVLLGYAAFFVAVCLLTIPGMITLFFIPMDRKDVFTAPRELD